MKNSTIIPIRNFLIVVIIISVTICSAEYFMSANPPINVNSTPINTTDLLYFNYEKSTIDDLASTLMTSTVYVSPESGRKENVYPLVDLSAVNHYDESTKNIVVIGDSFVWGFYSLNRNELFWPTLEKELRSNGYNCRVYGVGMTGASAFEELDWLTKTSLVEDLDPDLVIFGYVNNDWLSGERSYNPNNIAESSRFLSLMSKLFPNIAQTISYWPTLEYTLDGKNKFVIPLDEYAKTADFPIVYMTLPNAENFPKAYYKPLHKLYSKYTNVALYDCLYDFKHNFASEEHFDNFFVNSIDWHPGSATNKFYADYIVDFLEKDYPDVIGKSAGRDLNNYDINVNEWLPYSLNLSSAGRSDNSVTYTLDYPSETKQYSCKVGLINVNFEKYLLNYPLGNDYIKLSFAQPTDIKSVQITGDKIENVDLYCTLLNEKLGYDDHKIIPFGTKSADGKSWTDKSSGKVMSLCIHADCINKDGSNLKLVINK